MRIALFTPYSPEIGGGSVQLRSHLSQLSDLQINWYYLSNAAVTGEHRHWLGKQLLPGQFASDLASRSGFLPGSTKAIGEVADRIEADLYWVVAHYEGISLAAELLSRGKRIHLTVHDEPLAMLIRSRRFRALWPLMSLTFSKVLRGALSVDVTSTAMRDYFKTKYDVNCFALYKYLAKLPEVPSRLSRDVLTVGHIGSLYHPEPFRKFILSCRALAESEKRSLKIIWIGDSPEMEKICSENLARFEGFGELPEKEALPVLATCDLVYAMYPHGFRYQGFRRTSLPIKLSTYIQAQRPIFAHTPPDSGLARLVAKHGVGTVCISDGGSDIQSSLNQILQQKISRENFESIRADLMGEEQILQLRRALTI
jgi:hypothetical protein